MFGPLKCFIWIQELFVMNRTALLFHPQNLTRWPNMYDLNNLKRSNRKLFSLNNLILLRIPLCGSIQKFSGIKNGIKFLRYFIWSFCKVPDGSVIKIILNYFMYHAWLLYICFRQVRFVIWASLKFL